MRIVVLVLFLAGCSGVQVPPESEVLPELVYHTPLPSTPEHWSEHQRSLVVLFHVDQAGKVIEARFVNSTGDRIWEERALAEMKLWEFTPARMHEKDIPAWIRLPIHIQSSAPKPMWLEELSSENSWCADSAYSLLEAGFGIDLVLQRLSVVDPHVQHNVLGEIDIRRYSARIQSELSKIRVRECTKPLLLGRRYVVFRRLPGNDSEPSTNR